MRVKLESFNPKTYVAVISVETVSPPEMNLLTRSMYKRQHTYRIKYATFNINNSCLTDEHISNRMGQCPIEHSQEMIDGTFDISTKYPFSIRGEAEFTTRDIEGIPFHRTHLLSYAMNGEQISGYVEIARNWSYEHASNFPLSRIGILKEPDFNKPASLETGNCYRLVFKTVGMLHPDIIIKNAIEGMDAEVNEERARFDENPIIPKWLKLKYQLDPNAPKTKLPVNV